MSHPKPGKKPESRAAQAARQKKRPAPAKKDALAELEATLPPMRATFPEESAGRMQAILDNAARLRAWHQAGKQAAKERFESQEALDFWRRLYDKYWQEYPRLCYPGDDTAWNALTACEPEAVAIAIDFLQADPMFHRSGYMKERLWRCLKRCPLTPAQRRRLEETAFACLRQPAKREFRPMCRALRQIGSETFWQEVRSRAEHSVDEEKRRLGWLVAYAPDIPAGRQP